MKNRIIIAIPITFILVALVVVRKLPYILLVTFLAVLSQYETTKVLTHSGLNPNKYTGIIMGLGLYVAYLYSPNASLVLFAIIVMYILVWGVFSKKVTFQDAIASCFVLCYPGSFFLAFVMIGETKPYELSVYMMAIAMMAPVFSDVGAYFVGTAIGKTQLAPDISPRKTVEGSIGGLLGSVGLIGLIYLVLVKTNAFGLAEAVGSIKWYYVLQCALICAFVSQIGDLVASALKRYAGVKDFSKVLGEHGGVMDRMDSLLFSVTAVLIYFNTFIIGR